MENFIFSAVLFSPFNANGLLMQPYKQRKASLKIGKSEAGTKVYLYLFR